jgi:2-phosphosulfolactate phosphatase
MAKTVVIDCFPDSIRSYGAGWGVVGVDVIRATTTAVTAVATGRRCFAVPDLETAVPLAARLQDPLLVGELGGNMPYGFELNNSPAAIAARTDVERPMILISTSGTKLLTAEAPDAVYVGSLRNVRALADVLADRHERVAVIGAGTRGEFREEDQLGCSWIAGALLQQGFEPRNEWTSTLVSRWRDEPVTAIETSRSVEFLRDTGQLEDLEFVLGHVNDLDAAFEVRAGEIVRV